MSVSKFAEELKVAEEFGRAATTYSQHARAQAQCAQTFWQAVDRQLAPDPSAWTQSHSPNTPAAERLSSNLPPGPVLEFGCGTGFLTQGLMERFGENRHVHVTDASEAMVEYCRKQFRNHSANSVFYQLNAELAEDQAQPCSEAGSQGLDRCAPCCSAYALVVSSFAVQWFSNPTVSLERWLSRLLPGGWLVVALPTHKSFPQWRSVCQQLGLPRPGNPLPNASELHKQLVRSKNVATSWLLEESIPVRFSNSLDFLRHLKAIGASTRTSTSTSNYSYTQASTAHRTSSPHASSGLSISQMRLLLRTWDASVSPPVNCPPVNCPPVSESESASSNDCLPLQVDYHVAWLGLQSIA